MSPIFLQQGLLEAPVLDALHAFKARPREIDALNALREESVYTTALAVAEKMRVLARNEDSERVVTKKPLLNYRQFYVGCVAVGIVLNGQGRYEWWAFASTNTKATKGAEKFCAEMRCMRAARETNCACIGGFALVGENQPDGRSNILRKTLDPCGECRDCMRDPKNRPRLRSNTLIVTQKPLSQVAYHQPLKLMMQTHREDWP